jgi:hypothetical protein
MKLNFILAFLFLAFVTVVLIANEDETDLIGCTELNGMGCVCHTVERDFSVNVWVEGPETLFVGQTGMYKMLMSGGPAEAGGYNVAGRFGEMVLVDSFSFQHPLAMNELTQAFSLPFPTPQDTIYWHFGYKVTDSSITTDTIYSCGLSLVWDSIPDFHDRWNFGPKFPITILSATDVDESRNHPEDFILNQNYPNPFNPSTTISWQSKVDGRQTLKIFDLLGNEVATLIDEFKPAGNYEVKFSAKGGSASGGNVSDLPSGLYFYRLSAGKFTETKKMLLLR